MIDWLRNNYDDPKIEVAGQIIPIAIKRHATAKRLVLRLAPDGSEVRLTMPRWGRTKDALEFVQSRSEWLEGQMEKVERVEAPQPGNTIPYLGSNLVIDWQEDAPRNPVLHEQALRVGGPLTSLSNRLEKWLRAQALEVMTADLAHYCALAEKPAPELKLSRAQRRWGSCSDSGAVRMNWRLIMAPGEVRRSVVAHEVAHLVHFDHSPAFHRFLDKIFEGDITAANAWLKQHGRSLYRHFG